MEIQNFCIFWVSVNNEAIVVVMGIVSINLSGMSAVVVVLYYHDLSYSFRLKVNEQC